MYYYDDNYVVIKIKYSLFSKGPSNSLKQLCSNERLSAKKTKLVYQYTHFSIYSFFIIKVINQFTCKNPFFSVVDGVCNENQKCTQIINFRKNKQFRRGPFLHFCFVLIAKMLSFLNIIGRYN